MFGGQSFSSASFGGLMFVLFVPPVPEVPHVPFYARQPVQGRTVRANGHGRTVRATYRYSVRAQ